MDDNAALLARCHFPDAGGAVDLAVSGGPDSLGMLLLALSAQLRVTVHHVDHHARPTSVDDADAVVDIGRALGVPVIVHDVTVEPGANFEARARAARRGVLPAGILTGHTMDDLAETMIINLLRGAGHDGLAPMADDPSKPLRDLRRIEVHAVVNRSNLSARVDETNESSEFVRNRVRHEVLPMLCDVARRDVVPLLARQAALMNDERRWLDAITMLDAPSLADADCRELREWPRARLRRWLRGQLRSDDGGDGEHPPSADEVERAILVVEGDVVATQLSGGRRFARRAQRLRLE
ncbi:MAG TPA: tRNA lysidine(34) synthetase TilS [Acidimicrobiales bacterium]|nr:tRNA lysidine(34) synthetase TilS [Acidimicrobiales bacterium]